ncbi:SDR family oxidoreductase [bacterium]|nr:SDR family oxidoreductase [bacterium]
MDSRHSFGAPRKVGELYSLEGRVAVVTGGAGMYGSGISTALAEAGAKVVIASRSLDTCEQKAAELRAQNLDGVAAQVDIADEESVKALADHLMADYGRLDVLVNNAVARSTGGDFSTVSAAQWEETLKVNSTGILLATRLLGEVIAVSRPEGTVGAGGQIGPRGTGSIINIASIYGMVGPQFDVYGSTGMKNPAEYAFAKGGLINLTRYLAAFYAPRGVRVNAISPGGYFSNQPQEFVDNYCRRTPLGRMAGEEDIKGVALFLASEASAYVTGANLPLEGGWTAW